MTATRDLDFSRRLLKAWNALEGYEGRRRISQSEIGERVAAVMRRGRPYKQPAVSKWLKGTRPDDPVIRALASVLGCDETWLLRYHDFAASIAGDYIYSTIRQPLSLYGHCPALLPQSRQKGAAMWCLTVEASKSPLLVTISQ